MKIERSSIHQRTVEEALGKIREVREPSIGSDKPRKSPSGNAVFSVGISRYLEIAKLGKGIEAINVSDGNVHLGISKEALVLYDQYLRTNPPPLAVITESDLTLMELVRGGYTRARSKY